MKPLYTLCLLLLCIWTSPLQAAEITREMAEQYYNTCLTKQANAYLSEESQDYLCSCTASKMMENMTTEDIAAMNTQDETARQAYNYMLIKVYAPCMEYPARDHYYNTCINNDQTKTVTKDSEKMCGCMADKIGQYLGQNGEVIFEDILGRNPEIVDPMQALESDPEFQNYASQQLMSCL